MTYAASCSVSGVTEPMMRLANYYHSQSATSFTVNCDQGYSIRFSSMNLYSTDGASFLSNGPNKIRTRMTVSGPVGNLWNVPLTANTTGTNRYIISVHLEEEPKVSTPAGIYRDVIYVNLSF
ncbi:hypothetical protein [Acinetobacter sp. MB5]|uniref:hypothetical protein n=1 Tax=Acinetobacter sp. MB5 TaxID=2069438 RepID=UPI001D0DAC1E|nr:hypothetical protein [Acinetobacter sp. MB5]